jgi:hypothetical protein
MTKLAAVLVLAPLLVAACGKGGAAGASADGSAKPGSTGVASDAIDVPECEDYFKKWEECGKKNAAWKAVMADSVKQNREAWKLKAQTSAGKDELKLACKAATDAIGDACK